MREKLLKNQNLCVKTISFEKLKEISDLNLKRLNRNIDLEDVYINNSCLMSKKLYLEIILIHEHHLGKLIQPHFRCFVRDEDNNVLGIQDVFTNQWVKLN